MKKTLALALALFMVFTLAACGSGGSSNTHSGNDTGSSRQEPAVNKKGDFDSALEAIKMLEPENSVEEINAILGFEGELTDEENKIYIWNIADNERRPSKWRPLQRKA